MSTPFPSSSLPSVGGWRPPSDRLPVPSTSGGDSLGLLFSPSDRFTSRFNSTPIHAPPPARQEFEPRSLPQVSSSLMQASGSYTGFDRKASSHNSRDPSQETHTSLPLTFGKQPEQHSSLRISPRSSEEREQVKAPRSQVKRAWAASKDLESRPSSMSKPSTSTTSSFESDFDTDVKRWEAMSSGSYAADR